MGAPLLKSLLRSSRSVKPTTLVKCEIEVSQLKDNIMILNLRLEHRSGTMHLLMYFRTAVLRIANSTTLGKAVSGKLQER